MSGLSDLLLTAPGSAAGAIMVTLLLVSIVARELARDQDPRGQGKAVRHLSWLVHLLTPIGFGWMSLRLLVILN